MAKEIANVLLNEAISFNSVRVIGIDGAQLGVMSSEEALVKAYDEGLDLLCVSPKADIPVCKILDYGKYKFAEQKKAKEAKKNQKETEVKALRLSPVIDTGDISTKINQATKWLQDGIKVKVDMKFKGRMMTRQEVGMQIMTDFTERLADIAIVEKKPNLEGNILSVTLSPKKEVA